MAKGPERGIEYHMRLNDILARVAEERTEPRRLGPWLTLSRQAASGGAEIARRVADQLGWSLLGRELVESLAERLDLSPKMLELMDETSSNWFRDTLLHLFEPRLVEQPSYVTKLSKVMLLAACDGRVVLLGRGANFVLGRENGLRVLVVAPRELRVAHLEERLGLDRRTAERRLDELDENRHDFIHRHFHADVNHPDHYDLVLDASTFGPDGATDLICAAVRDHLAT